MQEVWKVGGTRPHLSQRVATEDVLDEQVGRHSVVVRGVARERLDARVHDRHEMLAVRVEAVDEGRDVTRRESNCVQGEVLVILHRRRQNQLEEDAAL